MKLGFSIASPLIILLFLAAPALAGPRLTFDKPVYDFQQVTQGKTIVHNFTFRNTGDAPATIAHVSSSCGCTVANVSEKIIPPGKSGTIQSTFDTTDFSGPVTKEVFVYLSGQQKPAYTLIIKGMIFEELVITPKQVNLGSVKAGVRKDVTMTMENKGNKALKITGVKTLMPQMKVNIPKKTLKPGEKTTFTVSITPRKGNRFINGYLTVTTNSAAKPEKTIAIFGVLD
jgi:hypothetical protein